MDKKKKSENTPQPLTVNIKSVTVDDKTYSIKTEIKCESESQSNEDYTPESEVETPVQGSVKSEINEITRSNEEEKDVSHKSVKKEKYEDASTSLTTTTNSQMKSVDSLVVPKIEQEDQNSDSEVEILTVRNLAKAQDKDLLELSDSDLEVSVSKKSTKRKKHEISPTVKSKKKSGAFHSSKVQKIEPKVNSNSDSDSEVEILSDLETSKAIAQAEKIFELSDSDSDDKANNSQKVLNEEPLTSGLTSSKREIEKPNVPKVEAKKENEDQTPEAESTPVPVALGSNLPRSTYNYNDESPSRNQISTSSRPKRACTKAIDYSMFVNPDESLEWEIIGEVTESSPLKKMRKNKKWRPWDKPSKPTYVTVNKTFIRNHLRVNHRTSRKNNFKIDPDVERDDMDMSYFYNAFEVRRLKLSYWTWDPVIPGPGRACKSTGVNLRKILHSLCPKLEVLTLEENLNLNHDEFIEGQNENYEVQDLELQSLILLDTQQAMLDIHLRFILKAAKKLEKLQFTFSETAQLTKVLTLLKDLTSSNYLKELNDLSFVSVDDLASVTNEHIVLLSELNTNGLMNLEISAGFDEVTGKAFEDMFKKHRKSLELFICKGTFFGDPTTKYFTVKLPLMPKLVCFYFGADYEFDSEVALQVTNGVRIASEDEIVESVHVIDEDKKDFIHYGISFPYCESLESIRIGNFCTVEDLHFSSFPKLFTFQVGGPWNKLLRFPSLESRKSIYPNLKKLQLPDCIKDPSLISEIRRVFPNVKEIWLNIPSAEFLHIFVRTMKDSRLAKLFMKLRFYFSWTLEEILVGKAHCKSRNHKELDQFAKLKEYTFFTEFAKHYNIETQESIYAEEGDEGIRGLKNLTDLEIEHVGKILRIPKGDKKWYSATCRFSKSHIGYSKYPISNHAFTYGLSKLKKICSFQPVNFICGQNGMDCFKKDLKLKSTGTFELSGTTAGQTTSTTNERRVSNIRVTIKPTFSNDESVKIKGEL